MLYRFVNEGLHERIKNHILPLYPLGDKEIVEFERVLYPIRFAEKNDDPRAVLNGIFGIHEELFLLAAASALPRKFFNFFYFEHDVLLYAKSVVRGCPAQKLLMFLCVGLNFIFDGSEQLVEHEFIVLPVGGLYVFLHFFFKIGRDDVSVVIEPSHVGKVVEEELRRSSCDRADRYVAAVEIAMDEPFGTQIACDFLQLVVHPGWNGSFSVDKKLQRADVLYEGRDDDLTGKALDVVKGLGNIAAFFREKHGFFVLVQHGRASSRIGGQAGKKGFDENVLPIETSAEVVVGTASHGIEPLERGELFACLQLNDLAKIGLGKGVDHQSLSPYLSRYEKIVEFCRVFNAPGSAKKRQRNGAEVQIVNAFQAKSGLGKIGCGNAFYLEHFSSCA